LLPDLLTWFFPMSLSYVTFTPLVVLLATAEYRVFRNHWRSLVICLALLTGILGLSVFRAVPLLFMVPLVLLVITMTNDPQSNAIIVFDAVTRQRLQILSTHGKGGVGGNAGGVEQ